MAGGSAAPAAEVPDDDFIDDGIDVAAEGEPLAPLGPRPRPNGEMYRPRAIGGVEDLAFLRDARDHREHVILYGPPGTGKSALPEAAFFGDAVLNEGADALIGAAKYRHLGFETIVCDAETTSADFFGSFVQDPGTGLWRWVDGPLTRAVRQKIPLFVDEILLAPPSTLAGTLYPLMDGRDVLRVTINPDLPWIPVTDGFFIVGAGNPDVPGADFSDALRSRFVHHIEVSTDWDLAVTLGVDERVAGVAEELDTMRRTHALSWSPQLRDLLTYQATAARRGTAFALNGLLGKAPFEDHALIQEKLAGLGEAAPLALGKGMP